MSDLLSLPFELIKSLLGGVSSDQAIPYFAPLYNLTVMLWMAAISAIFVAVFWKRFRGFAAFLTWAAIFLTLIHRGASPQSGDTNALSAALNISSSTLILIAFVILTLWIFSRLLRRKKVVYIPR